MIPQIGIEDHTWSSKLPTVRQNMATWLLDEEKAEIDPFAIADDLHNDLNAEVKMPPGTLRKVNEARALELPVVSQKTHSSLPTVYLYLLDKQTNERTHFMHFKMEDIVARGLGFAPTWVGLHPTSPTPIKPGEPPPSLLISIGLGCEPATEDFHSFPWPPVPMPMRSTLSAYELRVHLYQARSSFITLDGASITLKRSFAAPHHPRWLFTPSKALDHPLSPQPTLHHLHAPFAIPDCD